MERYRYTGPLEAVDVPIPGALIRFPRNEWVDPAEECEAANVPVEHLTIVLAGLGEDFQREGPVKAARTRKARKSAKRPSTPEAEASPTPAEPEQEEDQ